MIDLDEHKDKLHQPDGDSAEDDSPRRSQAAVVRQQKGQAHEQKDTSVDVKRIGKWPALYHPHRPAKRFIDDCNGAWHYGSMLFRSNSLE